MKNIDWKDLIKRAAWTFVEAFLVALPTTYVQSEDGLKAAWISALLSAAAAGVSAVKTLLVTTIQNGIQEQSAAVEEEEEPATEEQPTPKYKVYLSPSGQYGNTYAYGNTNEGTQCVLISKACETALLARGFEVINGADKDYDVRYAEAKAMEPDLYIPIHTNAFNGSVSGTRMFVKSFDSLSYPICKSVFARVDACCPGTSSNIKEVSNLEELNVMDSYGIDACYCECDFHDVPDVAKFIIMNSTAIGEAIAHGICDAFEVSWE